MTKKIRVITSFGGWFDMDEPDDFSLITYITSIRASGYLLNEGQYVPHEHIVSIFRYNAEAPPEGMQPVKSTLQ